MNSLRRAPEKQILYKGNWLVKIENYLEDPKIKPGRIHELKTLKRATKSHSVDFLLLFGQDCSHVHTIINSPIYRAQWLIITLSKGSTTVGTLHTWKRKQRRLAKRRASSTIKRWIQSKKNILSVLYRDEVTTHLHVFLTLGIQGYEESASLCGFLSPLSSGSGFTCVPEPVSMLWTTDISLLMKEIEAQFLQSLRLVTMLNEPSGHPHL